MTTPPTMTAADVTTSVRRHFGAERDGLGPEWAALDEFSLHTGAGGQRCDLFLVRAWSGRPKGHERIAVEVKVSRSDLTSELSKPYKSETFSQHAHRFILATPPGLVRPTDVLPEHWGLIECWKTSAKKRRPGIRNDDPVPLPEGALVEAFRRAARSESRIRGAEESAAADPALIPRMVKRANASAMAEQRAKAASRRDKDRLSGFLSAVAEAGGWFCVCGAPMVKPTMGVNDYRRRGHADGSSCSRGRYGTAQHDLGALAAALGIAAEGEHVDDFHYAARLGDPSPIERMVRAHGRLMAALEDTPSDPMKVLADLAEYLEPRPYDDQEER